MRVFLNILLVATLFLSCVTLDASAQSRRNRTEGQPSRLTQVENEVASLRRLIADLSVKLSVLERELRDKTGRLEEIEYKNRTLEDALSQAQNQLLLLSADVRNQRSANAETAGAAYTAAADPANTTPDTEAESEPAPAPAIELPTGTAAEQFDFAFSYVRKNDLETGARLLADVISGNQGDPVAGNAYYWLGRISLQQDRPAEAARNLLALLDGFPNHAKRGESFVDLAAALVALDVPDEACDALYEFDRLTTEKSPRLTNRASQLASEAGCE